MGDLLREAGRIDQAVRAYEAALDTPGPSDHARYAAEEGLGRCRLAQADHTLARAHARRAVALTEPMGADSLVSLSNSSSPSSARRATRTPPGPPPSAA